jgi:A/G-specific adenine glycosylase
VKTFGEKVIAWQRTHGRHDLPWQTSRDPYRIWLAEVMLQQTQVSTVIPYYRRFLERFPDLRALAAAPLEEVMTAWAGLGYYSRARNLHRCAVRIVESFGAEFPRSAQGLANLPGIGRSTAAAIAAFAFGERGAILDGNVKRFLARHEGIGGYAGETEVESKLWLAAESRLPEDQIEAYTQGMMDIGATVCIRHQPLCGQCPVAQSCKALGEDRIGEFPAPRPKRVRPLKQATLVLVRDSTGAVLLERRPPAGIWGGMASPPEFELGLDDDALLDAAAHALGIEMRLGERLPPVRHEFSHYSFVMHPRLAHLIGTSAAAESTHQWVHPSATQDAALPAPIRRMLLAFAS